MSIVEFAKEVRQGKLFIVTLSKVWSRDYWKYVITLPKGSWPKFYKVEVSDKVLVIKFSNVKHPGYKTVSRPNSTPQLVIPSRLIKTLNIEPGSVLARRIDNSTLIIYLT